MPEVVLSLPFTGRWLARNSPARRVPSHGTDLFGERYAIDFVGVDDRHRTADRRDWRTFLATEPPERFFAFGRPILAPADGTVVAAHDGEIDHEGRRSQLALVPYALGQAGAAPAGRRRDRRQPPDRRAARRRRLRRAGAPAGRLDPGRRRRRGDGGAADRGLRQLRQLDPAARARAGHGQPGPVRRPGRSDGVPALPRVAARREPVLQDRESGLPAEGAVVEPLPRRDEIGQTRNAGEIDTPDDGVRPSNGVKQAESALTSAVTDSPKRQA